MRCRIRADVLDRIRGHIFAFDKRLVGRSPFGRIRDRFEAIHFLDGRESAHRPRLRVRISLVPVEIDDFARRHDRVVPAVGGFDSPPLSAVRNRNGRRPQIVPQYLIPPDHHPAVFGKEFFGMLDQVTLHFVQASQLLGEQLAFGAGFPGDLAGLIAADVYPPGREQLHDLGQHTVHEFEGCGIAHAEFAARIGLSTATQFRIADENLVGVRREFDLGNHLDITGRSISHDLANVILRIITAIGPGRPLRNVAPVAEFPPLEPVGLRPESPEPGQQRVPVDLNAPAAVVGQVQVEDIELVTCHFIEYLENLFFGKEMARNVEVDTPVTETRIIGNLHTRDTFCREQLQQRLPGIEQPGRVDRGNPNAVAADFEPIPLA